MKTSFFITVSILALTFQVVEADIIYVDQDANGSNNGNSWLSAYKDLQDAIDNTSPGDTVWVAEGTYYPTDDGDQLIYFRMPDGVSFYGGFNGAETQLSQRDWEVNETILSGDIGTQGDILDNTYHVVYYNDITSSNRIDGFIIQSGNATAPGSFYSYGGGMWVRNSSPQVYNCTFEFNKGTGGAIAHTDAGAESTGILNVTGCTFYQNAGAVLYLRGTQSNITDCVINENTSPAVYIDNGECIMDRVIVSGGVSNFESAAIYVGNLWSTSLKMRNSLVVGNLTNGFTSALSIHPLNNSNNVLHNCTFAHNRATAVGQAFDRSSAVSATDLTSYRNCIIWGNIGDAAGGNLQIAYDTNVDNCLVDGGYPDGTNITSSDPVFVNPGPASQSPLSIVNYDYSLQSSSPAINNGDNASVDQFYDLDLAGSERISAGIVDLGAYEYYYCSASINITANGPLNICEGESVNLSATAGGISYSWSNGGSSQSTNVSQSGIYSVEVFDGSGCYGVASVEVDVFSASVQITGDTDFCEGESTTLTATSQNGTLFNWSSGQSGATITVDTPDSYTVTLTSVDNCTATASTTVSEISVLTPSIFQNSSVLTSSSATGNQWYLNGNIIGGATSQDYTPVENGQYTVVVMQNGCSSAPSTGVNVTDVGIVELEKLGFKVYPNPITDHFIIKTETANQAYSFHLTDAIGRSVLSRTGINDDMQYVVVSDLKAGIYLLSISTKEKSGVIQIIKN